MCTFIGPQPTPKSLLSICYTTLHKSKRASELTAMGVLGKRWQSSGSFSGVFGGWSERYLSYLTFFLRWMMDDGRIWTILDEHITSPHIPLAKIDRYLTS